MSQSNQEQSLESYKKIRILGKGSYGKAFLVECGSDKSLAVIKKIDIKRMSEEDKRATLREAKILEVLNHPNIIRFREVYKTKVGQLCIVMDYADGGDLDGEIKKRKASKQAFKESEIMNWFAQLILALKHVHDRKIIHRDIKTQNVFLTSSGMAKIGDFGVSKVMNNTKDLAATVIGTPYYLSPEIVQSNTYDYKTDIWSMGILLYEMCAFRPPFNGDNLHMLAIQIVSGQYQPVPSNYSKGFQVLMSRLLTVDPLKRPTADEVIKDPLVSQYVKKLVNEKSFKAEFKQSMTHAAEVFDNAQKKLEQKVSATPKKAAYEIPKERVEPQDMVEPSRPVRGERIEIQNTPIPTSAKASDLSTTTSSVDPISVANKVLARLDNMEKQKQMQPQKPVAQQKAMPYGQKPFSQMSKAVPASAVGHVQGKGMVDQTFEASVKAKKQPKKVNHKEEYQDIRRQREEGLNQKRNDILKAMQAKQHLEEARRLEKKQKAQEVRNMGLKAKEARMSNVDSKPFKSLKKQAQSEVAVSVKEEMIKQASLEKKQAQEDQRAKMRADLAKKRKAASKGKGVQFEMVGIPDSLIQDDYDYAEQKEQKDSAEKEKESIFKPEKDQEKARNSESMKYSTLADLKKAAKTEKSRQQDPAEVEILVSMSDTRKQAARTKHELDHYRRLIESMISEADVVGATSLEMSHTGQDQIPIPDKKQSAEVYETFNASAENPVLMASTTNEGSSDEAYDYSDDEDHAVLEDEFNQILEEAIQDEAENQSDREDDDEGDVMEENDFLLSHSTNMSMALAVSKKKPKVEYDQDTSPQKPEKSVLANQALQDQTEEDMMRHIIDSKGRHTYELMYKLVDQYKLERFKEATQVRIKAEVCATLETEGKPVPDQTLLSEIFGLVSTNMILEDYAASASPAQNKQMKSTPAVDQK